MEKKIMIPSLGVARSNEENMQAFTLDFNARNSRVLLCIGINPDNTIRLDAVQGLTEEQMQAIFETLSIQLKKKVKIDFRN